MLLEPFRRHDPPKCTQAEFDPPKCTEAEIDPPKGRFSSRAFWEQQQIFIDSERLARMRQGPAGEGWALHMLLARVEM